MRSLESSRGQRPPRCPPHTSIEGTLKELMQRAGTSGDKQCAQESVNDAQIPESGMDSYGGQLETRKGCDENQEIHFRFGHRPVIGHCCMQAHRPVSTSSGRRVQDGDRRFGCHPQMTSSFEVARVWPETSCELGHSHKCALWGERISMVTRTAGTRKIIVTQVHMSAAAHSWSWSGGIPNTLGAER